MKRVNISIPEEVHSALEAEAKRQKRTVANLVGFLAQQEAERLQERENQTAKAS
jgi:predicted HicB family RNase H-like nuclease